jgi:hypothetical protein
VFSTSLFLAGTRIRGSRWLAAAIYLPAAVLAIVPSHLALGAAVALTTAGVALGRPFARGQRDAAVAGAGVAETLPPVS